MFDALVVRSVNETILILSIFKIILFVNHLQEAHLKSNDNDQASTQLVQHRIQHDENNSNNMKFD